MAEAKFVGVRLAPDILKLVEQTAKEEYLDKSGALRELIVAGREKKLEQRVLEFYRMGRISADRAAEIAGITLTEMMSLISQAGLKSEETFAEYQEGLK
ncbi:UPF0175 family protein, partial [Candidatus Woesearchaeota archaeon]|nr:UPF0175 family protein [Candidatus Woesearchaeota archaeon]